MKLFEIYVVFDSLSVKIDLLLLFHLKKLLVSGMDLLSLFYLLSLKWFFFLIGPFFFWVDFLHKV